MKQFNRRALLALGAVMIGTGMAAAQDAWPTEPLRVYVGFPAGSSPDVLARLITEPLSRKLGQPVVVENKPGAGGVIGVQQMLAGKTDYAFGTTINGPLTTSHRLVENVGYDVGKDIAPVALIATSPLVLAMAAEAAPTDIASFIEAARAEPGAIAYGSVGQGSGAHLTAELFADAAGIEMLHIPFTSYAEVTTSIIGGEIDAGFMAPSAALPQVQADKMKMLGITSSEPFAQVPDVPVIAGQAGIPDDFRAELWNAFIAPAGTDPAILERLNTEVNAILDDPEVQKKMLAMGWQAQGGTADDLARRIADDTSVWGNVIDRIEAQ